MEHPQSPSQYPLLPLQALRAAGGRGFSDTDGAARARAGAGLLYALSGSLKPLCCWCVEGGGSVSASDDGGAAGAAGAPAAGSEEEQEEGEEDDVVSGLIARALRRARSLR